MASSDTGLRCDLGLDSEEIGACASVQATSALKKSKTLDTVIPKKPLYTPSGFGNFITARVARMAVAAQEGSLGYPLFNTQRTSCWHEFEIYVIYIYHRPRSAFTL
eukprot:343496-Amphidinium_carterae.1